MSTHIEQNQPIALVICPTCSPAGRDHASCTRCKGMYSGIDQEGVFLYWGLALTSEEIRFRRAYQKVHTFFTFLAFAVGVFTVLYLVFSLREDPLVFFTSDFWWSGQAPVVLFWFGGLAWLYGIMRVVRSTQRQEPIQYAQTWEEKNTTHRSSAAASSNPWSLLSNARITRKDIAKSFSKDALLVTERAYFLAEETRSAEVTPYHLFIALLGFSEIQSIIVRLGISIEDLRNFSKQFLQINSGNGRSPVYSSSSVELFFASYLEAQKQQQRFVGVGDLLYCLYRSREELQKQVYDMGVDSRQMTNVIAWVRIRAELYDAWHRRTEAAKRRPKGDTNRAMTALATPYLDSLADDLTRLAAYGYTPPLIGREGALQTVFRALQGGKRSVLLVGPEGVGKEAIVEGLAWRMVEEHVPSILSDKRLMVLSPARLLAGASPAEAQERLLHLLAEVRRSGNIILFIPNIDSIIGITQGGDGSLDVAGVLARELQQGSALMFATTTPESYRRYVASTAIASAFTKIDIEEMSVDETIRVLEAKAGYIEHEHEVWFSYAAIEAAAQLSNRFIFDDRLPNKAILIIKEAAEGVRTSRGKDALVTKEDVARIVSEKSKIPVAAVTEDESEKLLRLEEQLHKRVIGQEEAVRVVSSALRRARAQLSGGKRTIANFLFLGPTGVGKTELAKTVADVYFGGEDQMIRLDMSEYQDATSITRLIGQPGVKGSGVLTESIKDKPFALLLLDELEKADPKVLNLFLQVMDDGRITDSLGNTIDCTNIILIATSNAGTAFVQQQLVANIPYETIQDELLRGKLMEWFRPEFLNRFDAIVLFQTLSQEEIRSIAGLMLRSIGKHLEDQGMYMMVDEPVLHHLASVGFDPQFGARPMRRVVQDKVENPIAELLLAKKLRRGETVHFTTEGVRVEQSTP